MREKLGYPVRDLEPITCLYTVSLPMPWTAFHIAWSRNCYYGNGNCNLKTKYLK